MQTPKFKVGDTAQLRNRQDALGIIVDGPFVPGARFVGQGRDEGWPNEFTYVILFPLKGHPQMARLVGEGALMPVGRWEDCPGEHRQAPNSCIHPWQRRVS